MSGQDDTEKTALRFLALELDAAVFDATAQRAMARPRPTPPESLARPGPPGKSARKSACDALPGSRSVSALRSRAARSGCLGTDSIAPPGACT